MTPPPLRLEVTYAVTAWTQAVEDEHRLLSQVLGVLFAYRQLPQDPLAGAAFGADRFARGTRSGSQPHGKADFWTAVGGQYKASIDYVVHARGRVGRRVRRAGRRCARRRCARAVRRAARTLSELHRFGGTVVDADGDRCRRVGHAARPRRCSRHRPRGALPASTDAARARTARPRTRDGDEARTEIAVPGGGARPRRSGQETPRKKGGTEWATAAAPTVAPAHLAPRAQRRRSSVDDAPRLDRPRVLLGNLDPIMVIGA